MGLDITAYSRVLLLPPHERTEECYETHVCAFAYSCFPRSFRGLADADVEFQSLSDGTSFMGGRCYDISQSATHCFSAGSYHGYGEMRNLLSNTFLGVDINIVARYPERYEDKPFFELINFADNEGCIGPEAAKDLLMDFVEGKPTWAAARPDDRYPSVGRDHWTCWYDNWTTACAFAADDGLIQFH